MNVRFSFLDLDVDTNNHQYGVFLGNWFTVNKNSPHASEDHNILRVEYSVLSGFELEILGINIL